MTHRIRLVLLAVIVVGSVDGCGAGPDPAASASPDAGFPAGGSPTPVAGVMVHVDAPRYSSDAVVAVRVDNTGPLPVHGEDRRTGCTAVLLQRWDTTRWVAVDNCWLGRPPVAVRVAAYGRYDCRIELGRAGPDGMSAAAAGRYRAVFAFTVGAEPGVGEAVEAVSDAFTVDG